MKGKLAWVGGLGALMGLAWLLWRLSLGDNAQAVGKAGALINGQETSPLLWALVVMVGIILVILLGLVIFFVAGQAKQQPAQAQPQVQVIRERPAMPQQAQRQPTMQELLERTLQIKAQMDQVEMMNRLLGNGQQPGQNQSQSNDSNDLFRF
jgi:hypothetical protein